MKTFLVTTNHIRHLQNEDVYAQGLYNMLQHEANRSPIPLNERFNKPDVELAYRALYEVAPMIAASPIFAGSYVSRMLDNGFNFWGSALQEASLQDRRIVKNITVKADSVEISFGGSLTGYKHNPETNKKTAVWSFASGAWGHFQEIG